jgi:putative ABC transport system substrate-binding protein
MIAPKLFEVLQEAVPKPGTIGFLVNPTGPEAEAAVSEVRSAAQALGHGVMVVHASTQREIDDAFAALGQNRVGALLVGNDVFFYSRREQIVRLAAGHALPAIYNVREYPQAGGLMSYGTSVDGCAAARRNLRWPNSQRRETGRPAGRAIDESRVGD